MSSPTTAARKRRRVETPSARLHRMVRVRHRRRRTAATIWRRFVTAEITLLDHLSEQMALAITDPVQRMIGQYLIDMVDESGYLIGDLQTVADKLGAPLGTVEAVLTILQALDPPGVCAPQPRPNASRFNSSERDRFDPAMRALVENLPLLAKRDLAALRRLCGVDDEDLADMIAEIRNLNPKPGLAFGSTLVQPIVPDVFVRAAPDGSWQVELNSDTLPKVLISQRYHAQVSKTTRNDRGQDLSCRLSADRDVAGARA